MRIQMRLFLTALLCAMASTAATAQQARPLRILVGFPPGSTIDVMARQLGEKLRDSLARPIVVENKVGAVGILGAETLKAALPDGTTISIVPVAVPVIFLHSYSNLRYNAFTDFEPVAHLANFAIALAVSNDTPATTLAEYIALARTKPELTNYGSAAAGSIPHFLGVMLARESKLNLVHIPYKGTAPMLQALAGGEIKAGIGTIADIGGLVRGGKARMLAVASANRSPQFAGVPTFREAGVNLEGSGWYAIYAPGKTPREEIDRQAKAIIEAVNSADLKERWTQMGLEPTGLGPDELARIALADYERWGPVIKASGFKPDQ